jgi:hypothetical protein
MIIYGGIFEVTKELNDMHVFDLKKEQWVVLFEELNSPQKANSSNPNASPNSVGMKRSMNKQMTTLVDSSPRKIGKEGSLRI